MIAPSLEAAVERSNALDPFLPQGECDARARGLARTGTVEDDLPRWRYFYILVLLKPARANAYRTRNRQRPRGIIQMALKIHKQNGLACIQLLSELFWSDPCKFELTHEALAASELLEHVEAESRCNSQRHKGPQPQDMSGNKV